MSDTQINGQYRNYANVKVDLLGVSGAGYVKAISYSSEDSIDPVKAVGTKKVVGFVQGDQVHEGSITFYSEFLDILQRSLPKGQTIMDIAPFTISVTYVDNNNIQVAHALKYCKFKKNGRSGEAGSNDALEMEIPLFIGDIDYAA